MDKKSALERLGLVVLLATIGATGIGIASFISTTNIYVARGILGCAVIYLLYREVHFTMKNEPVDALYGFLRNVRHLVWSLGLVLVLSLGWNEVLQLLFFIIRSLRSFVDR